MADGRSRRCWWVPLVALLVAPVTAVSAQSQASISGVVTDSLSKRPLVGALVSAVTDAGTVAGSARVGDNGRYSIVTTSVGSVMLRVRLVGYAQDSRRLALVAGESYTANFQLSERLA